MTVAITSLVIQKLLLVIVSDVVFSSLLSALGVGVVAALLLPLFSHCTVACR